MSGRPFVGRGGEAYTQTSTKTDIVANEFNRPRCCFSVKLCTTESLVNVQAGMLVGAPELDI